MDVIWLTNLKTLLLGCVAVALVLAVGGGSTNAAAPAARGAAAVSDAAPATPTARPAATPAAKAGVFRPVTIPQLRAQGKVARTHEPFFRGGGHARSATSPKAPVVGSTIRTPATTASTSPRVFVYNGLNKDGIAASDNSFQADPPDSTGSIGPGYYVEIANSIIHVWDRNLNSVSSAPLDSFIGAPGDPFCDPQVQWDQAAGRWLFSALLCNTSSSSPQDIVFGWSLTSNPSNLSTGWCTFGLDTHPWIFDYGKLGHTGQWLILGGNFYDETNPSTNPPFLGSAVTAIQLPAYGVAACPSVFPHHHDYGPALTNASGAFTFTPVPVNTNTTASNGYILSAEDPSGSNGNPAAAQNAIAVFHIDSAGGLHTDPEVVVNAYSTPPPANELGGTLDALAGQLTQAVGDPTTGMWTQHTVSGGAGTKVTWYEITVNGVGVPVKAQEGDVTMASEDVYNAAISPSWNGDGAAIFYNHSSTTTTPTISVQNRRTGTTPLNTMAPGTVDLQTSPAADADFSCTAPYGPPCRWGDYAGASPDPANAALVWGTSEYVTANTSAPAWRDRNFAVAIWVPPSAPTNVTVTSTGTDFACLSWTPPANNGGAPILDYIVNSYDGVTPARSVGSTHGMTIACVSGLTPGVLYTFKVIAVNVAGAGPESAPAAATLSRDSTVSSGTPASAPRTTAPQTSPAAPPTPR